MHDEINLTDEQLEELLKTRREKARREAEKKREEYERDRDKTIMALTGQAMQLNELLTGFKKEAFESLTAFYKRMLEYGGVKEESKGNFQIISGDGQWKVVFRIQVNKAFDERAAIGEKHLKNFMSSFIKKRNEEAYDLVTQLMQRNTKGDYDIGLVNRLYAMKDKYDHPEWKAGIEMFQQAYVEVESASYINFYQRIGDNSWRLINLRFSNA